MRLWDCWNEGRGGMVGGREGRRDRGEEEEMEVRREEVKEREEERNLRQAHAAGY